MGEIFERQRPIKPLEWTGERLTTAVDGQVEIEHLHRYFFARELVRGLDVLDVASGEGYGTALLAQTARSAVGVELSSAAVGFAATTYRLPNLRFQQGDARALPLADDSVDIVVSFETIEHFYEQEAFLLEVKRVLRSAGMLIVSSPDRDTYSPLNSEANPYHARELSRAEFTGLLQSTFGHVRILSQRPMIGSVLLADTGQSAARLTFERRGGDHYEASPGISRPLYLVALASDAEQLGLPDSIYVETSEVGPVLSRSGQYGDLVKLVNDNEQTAAAVRTELQSSLAEAKAHVLGLQGEVDRLGRDAEGYRSQAEAAQQRLREAEEHEPTVAALSDELTGLRSMLAEARQAVQSACSQRDMARLSLRRVSASAQQAWRSRLAGLERDAARQLAEAEQAWRSRLAGLERDAEDKARQVAAAEQAWCSRLAGLERDAEDKARQVAATEQAWRSRLAGLERDAEDKARQVAAAAADAEYWKARYFGLRGRLERILRRFWVLRLAKLFPRSLRRWVRERGLGASR